MEGMLADKVALVTGAGSGIGEASARLFAREGARVLVSDVDAAAGAATADAIRNEGGEALFIAADVAQEEQVEALVARGVEQFSRIDCALNNAGITGVPQAVHEMSAENWSRVLSINLNGVLHCMKHELPLMQRQGRGSIVNMSSGAGIIPTPGLSAYCASKHAVLGLTKTAAVENARTGVRVNAICPGSTDTAMLRNAMSMDPSIEKMVLGSMPGGRLGTADEVAQAALWLCSDRSSFVSGHSMLVDGASVAR
jgi:NAD(P)-dependent dehydrogenase (short-subunit alcohol dehydrogenase family)